MKFERNLFIFLISLLIIVLLIVYVRRYNTYKNFYEVAKMPFETLSILDNKVELADNQKSYNLQLDCSSLKDENTQIVSYTLQKGALDSNITISSKVYNGDSIVKTDYSQITSINTIISIVDPEKKYEQIFSINATCE